MHRACAWACGLKSNMALETWPCGWQVFNLAGRWSRTWTIHQFIHYNEIMSNLYAPHRPAQRALNDKHAPLRTDPPGRWSTVVCLFLMVRGVVENHRTIKIIIKGHARAALIVAAHYCCCCCCPMQNAQMALSAMGGWLGSRPLALGLRVAIKFEFHMLAAGSLATDWRQANKVTGAASAERWVGRCGGDATEEWHPAALSVVQCQMEGGVWDGGQPFDLFYFPFCLLLMF